MTPEWDDPDFYLGNNSERKSNPENGFWGYDKNGFWGYHDNSDIY